MLLRLNSDETRMLHSALREYAARIREQARPFGAGYSQTAMQLCERRARAEDLLSRVERGGDAFDPSMAEATGEILPVI